jgi:hypothetical protein
VPTASDSNPHWLSIYISSYFKIESDSGLLLVVTYLSIDWDRVGLCLIFSKAELRGLFVVPGSMTRGYL